MRRPLVAMCLGLASLTVAGPVQSARFAEVRVTEAAPDATGAVPMLELEVPAVPGPHPVLLQPLQDGVDPEPGGAAAWRMPGWIEATVRLRAASPGADLAATLDFSARQIGAWGGDRARIVLRLDAAQLSLLDAAFAATRNRPAGVIVTVGPGAVIPAEPLAPGPLLVLFDPDHDGARRDALRIGAAWRRAGQRADVLPMRTHAGAAERARLIAAWAAALDVPRLARWETLAIAPAPAAASGPPASTLALVAHAGRLHGFAARHGIGLWIRDAAGSWSHGRHWPEAEALVWAGSVTGATPRLHAVLIVDGRPALWRQDAAGGWQRLAVVDQVWSAAGSSRVIGSPGHAFDFWIVDAGRGGTVAYELVETAAGAIPRPIAPGLRGALVDALIFEDQPAVATRDPNGVGLWSLDATTQRWRARARLDARTSALAVTEGDGALLAFGSRRIERLAAGDAVVRVELELADALAGVLATPADRVLRATGTQVARLVHPETGEAALAVGLDVADPDPRAPPARFLVRDAGGRYAIGEAWEAVSGTGGWPRVLVQDPDPDAGHVIHLLAAAAGPVLAGALRGAGPRRGLWRGVAEDAWLGLERLETGWLVALVLPGENGHAAWVGTGAVTGEDAADRMLGTGLQLVADDGGVREFGGAGRVEPLDIAFGAQARAACARDGRAGAAARVTLGGGDAVRHHCFAAPVGSPLPLGLNGAWGDGAAEARWIALVDAVAHRAGVAAEVVLVVRDRDGVARLLRGAGPADRSGVELPLYARCPGCGGHPLGSLLLNVDGPCGEESATLAFVAQLPAGAGFRQRPPGPAERLAGGACY